MGKLTSFADDAYPTALDASGFPDPGFSLDVARIMAWASQLAYETEAAAVFNQRTHDWGWGSLTPIQFMTDLADRRRFARGYVAHLPDATIVAFCGTEPDRVSDVLIDLDLLPRGGDVSHGMMRALDAVWTTVRGQIGTTGKPIYLTGHSLGGAFAVLAARKLALEPPPGSGPVHGVYTFGMPRIGDPDFAALYNALLGSRTYRLVHGDDIVANIPPTRVLLQEFRHVGRLLRCDHHGMFAGEPDQSCEDAVLGPWAAAADLFHRLSPGLMETIANVAGLSWSMPLPDELCPPNAPRKPYDFPSRYKIAETLVPILPPQARDHVMDEYLRALGCKFRGD